MKKSVASIVLISTLGCSSPSEETSSIESLADVVSMTQRGDGHFDVICNDGSTEVVTHAQVQNDQVCIGQPLPDPDPELRTVSTSSRRLVFSNTSNSKSFGRNIWEGYLSFTLSCIDYCDSNFLDTAKVRDGLGQEWRVPRSGNIVFNRLVLPVNITTSGASGRYAVVFEMRETSYEISRVNPIPETTISAVNGIGTLSLAALARQAPGSKISFTASLHAFNNFTSGTACTRVIIRENTGNEEAVLDGNHPYAQIEDITAPVSVTSSPTCQSTRLPNPENDEADLTVNISAISVGDPI